MASLRFPSGVRAIAALAVLCVASRLASAGAVNATYNSAADVPVTVSSYTATGNTVSFTLNFAPATGTDLMVVQNTGLAFIVGKFDNLAQGQSVALKYSGKTYTFVANYYGGTGNDLVLVWASKRAYAWGNNSHGQLGNNNNAQSQLPTPVTTTGVLADKTITALAGGWSYSLALCSDGTVAAWGVNDTGQLGDNTTSTRSAPATVNAAPGVSALYGKTVVAIATGAEQSLALCSDGTVAAWGDNDFGQLGDNTTSSRTAPVAVNTAPGISALSGKTVVAIAAGYEHSLALCSDGTLAAWGDNTFGELGDNKTATNTLVPVLVNTNSGVSALYGKKVVAIAAGGLCSLALCSDGTVAAWGRNRYGELGDGSQSQRNAPVAVNTDPGVSTLSGKTVVAVAAGGTHSLALCSDGSVVSWGWDAFGQLGDNFGSGGISLVPVTVSTDPGVSALYGKTVVAIAAGDIHNLALCSDGTVAAWGGNSYGQLGDNSTTERLAPVIVNVSPLSPAVRFTSVACGSDAEHSLALVAAPPAGQIRITSARTLANSSFQFGFTNNPGAFFSALASTNPALPGSNWTVLDSPIEVSPGQFQVTDPQAASFSHRVYRLRSP